jgi:hypothetical protein
MSTLGACYVSLVHMPAPSHARRRCYLHTCHHHRRPMLPDARDLHNEHLRCSLCGPRVYSGAIAWPLWPPPQLPQQVPRGAVSTAVSCHPNARCPDNEHLGCLLCEHRAYAATITCLPLSLPPSTRHPDMHSNTIYNTCSSNKTLYHHTKNLKDTKIGNKTMSFYFIWLCTPHDIV